LILHLINRWIGVKTLLLLCIFLCTQAVIAQNDASSTTKVQAIFDQFMEYRHQNKIAQAMETLDEASDIAESNEDTKLLLDTYQQYARIFLEEGDRETALRYWDRASIYLKDISYSYGQAFQLYLDAALRYDEGNNFQALKLLDESRKISNNRNLSNNILLLEASIFTNIEKYDDAIKNLHALIVNSDDKERAYLAAKANLQLAVISVKLNDYEEGIIHSKAALELSQKHGFAKIIKDANEELSNIYEKTGNYQQALIFNKGLANIKDSIFNVEKAKLESKTADDIRSEHMANATGQNRGIE